MGKLFDRIIGRRGPMTASMATEKGGEDPLDMLRVYDVVFLVDDSGSVSRDRHLRHRLTIQMSGARWDEARDALMDVAEQAARYDEDGVDVYFLNSRIKGTSMKVSCGICLSISTKQRALHRSNACSLQ